MLSGWAVVVFECLQRIFLLERVEVVDSVFFSQLFVSFEACLKRSLSSSNFLDFLSNVGIVVLSDFGNAENW